MNRYLLISIINLLCALFAIAVASAQEGIIDKSFDVSLAKQGVAVDSRFFYVVNNNEILKFTKNEGDFVKKWKDTTATVKHLNSGIIVNEKLYCANSNYPDNPMASSIEIFNPETLQHTGNISLGIYMGSATWLDFYNNHWYIAFAHYTGKGSSENKTNHWTQLVKFTKEWQRVGGWIFPEELINEFDTRSNSGGFITDSGVIYVTGHDNKKLYQLHFPDMGYTLKWSKTYSVPVEGQGIALDKTADKFIIYGIIRSENKVVKTSLKK